MKKLAVLLLVLTVLFAWAVPAYANATSYPPPFESDLGARSIYLMNVDSKTAVYEKNVHERVQPGYMTHIMTAIVALEAVEEPEYEKTILKTYIQNELYNLNDNTYGGIYIGDELTINDLLHAMMLQNVNMAAMMLADYIGDGSIEYFCELMNQKAQEIGAVNTNFANCTGIYDENSYTTAYDMALIAQYAMDIPLFEEIVIAKAHTSVPTVRAPQGIVWTSNNELQKSGSEYYYEGVRGIKAGTIEQAGRSSISMATRDGYTYLLVVLGAPISNSEDLRYEKNQAWVYSKYLYDWAFETFTVKTLMNVGDTVTDVAVRLSWDVERIGLLAADKFASLVPNEVTEDSLTTAIVIEREHIKRPIKGQKGKTEIVISAPIEKGETIGYVKLMLAGEEVGKIPLVAAQSVEESLALLYLDKVQSVFNTFWFKFILVFLIVIIVLYIALMILRNHNKRRYASRRKGGGSPKVPKTKKK